jgi:hypothetical protein
MGVRSKALVAVLLVGGVVGGMVLQNQGASDGSSNQSLFQGKLMGTQSEESAVEDTDNQLGTDILPDLRILAEVVPADESGDISVDVTIENLGPGDVDGSTPFKYTIYLDDQEVFSNIDSYTSVAAGDSFNFIYPVSHLIYDYENGGEIRVIVDEDQNISEAAESNNEVTLNF